MEQHPIPRNISGFQFRLVGDMTLRQFAYLASGVSIAFIVYKASPLPAIITIPIAGLIALMGFAFAFVPIQERPLDKWIVAFIRSVFSPTQYLWVKDGVVPEILTRPTVVETKKLPSVHQDAQTEARDKLLAYLKTLPSQPHQTLNLKEKSYIDSTLRLFNESYAQPTAAVSLQPTQQPYISPTTTVVKKQPEIEEKQTIQQIPTILPQPATPQTQPVSPRQEEQKGESKIDSSKIQNTPPSQPRETAKIPEQQDIQNQIHALASEKEKLLNELDNLKKQMEKMKAPDIVKPELGPELKKTPTIKAVTAHAAIDELGMPQLPQTPNLVMGVVKDAQKKLLPNIILTIKDNKGLPIRALKTNKLGQFATATPLGNGTYYLELEDPLKRFVFDIAQISLSGKVFLPIEIVAKGEKELLREKLNKELFTSANV